MRTLPGLATAMVLLLGRSALAQDQPAPPPQPQQPDNADAIKRLEQHVADLEARIGQEQKAREDQGKKLDALQTAAAAAAAPAPPNPDYAPEKSAFGFADFTWMPASSGSNTRPLSFGPFTGEIRVDTVYHYEFSNPSDDTISGSSEVFRSAEFQLTQFGIGGDFLYKNVIARLMTQFGMYSQTTPRNDASAARGQWNLADAYRYVSEAYGGYHIDAMDGINVEAGIFMSYIGLWSYYNFDNWTYQPSYVSSNTPWFFNGARVQIYTSDKLKIEPWLINGWQAYGRFNEAPGTGGQILWRPNGWLSIVGNQYIGADTLGVPHRVRVHTDDSIMVKYYDHPESFLDKAAFSLTLDAGCEWGGGVSCWGSSTAPAQFFLGFMAYNRLWFDRDLFGLTLGGGVIHNPGRYLVLMPPINGATAYSGTPYFTEAPGDPFVAWDAQATVDYMPNGYITFRLEYTHRAASVPYFEGHNGVTPPNGSGSYVNQGPPGSAVPGWAPDLVNDEDRVTLAMLIKL
jgi:hypothetical protein